MRFLRELHYEAECDRCRLPFRADRGGVCAVCSRVLCNAHLYGSFWRRLLVDMGFGGSPTCQQCRSSGGSD
jgi:hypothetical protein